MKILAIDPGPAQSGFVVLTNNRVESSGVMLNDDMRSYLMPSNAELLAIEMIASYGMPVGREVFETCVYIGRLVEAWNWARCLMQPRRPSVLVYRKDVKMHLCGTPRAKDGHIRQALIDLLGPPGKKSDPGPTYGVKSHAWAALAVAVTAASCQPDGIGVQGRNAS